MRRTIAALTVAVLAGAVVATQALSAGARVVSSASGSGHGMGFDPVTGEQDYRTFSFSAKSYSDGTSNGQAQVFNRAQELKQHIDVDCLSVRGTKAVVGGVIRRSTVPRFVGMRVLFAVRDNGEGRHGPRDQLTNIFREHEFQPRGLDPDCRLANLEPTREIENGNIQVRG